MNRLFFLPLITLLASPAFASGDMKAAPLQEYLHLPVTNSILTSWFVTVVALIAIRLLVGKAKLVPGRGQAVMETVVCALRDLHRPIVGKKAFPWAFPVLITLFFFILIHNWSGLFPGVGTVGWGESTGETVAGMNVVHVHDPILRPHTADFNGTVALALFSFGAWLVMILKFAGPGVIWHDLFGNKADKKQLAAPIYYGLSLIFLLVGVIEVGSILIRPFTLSVRLFGNVFGGENLLHATAFTPPFYFLEILVGLVQATVFTLLSAVYIGLICNHGDHDHAEDEHH